ncbi:MAG: ABC transporter permease [Chloroflexota bacterium]|nr:ABC transporter permease [Chloroflexota bacterium]
MQRYLARRLSLAIPTVLGVTIIIFIAMRLLPGDPLVAIFGMEGARRITPEQRANLEQALGLSDPYVVQYGKWLRDIGTGEFGKSLLRGDSVTQFVLRRGPITLEIAVIAMFISWAVGFPVGIISALKPNTWMDFASRFFSILFVAIPGFWLGLVVVLVLILWFNYKAPILPVYLWKSPWENIQMVIGPGLVMGLGFAGFVARMARSSLLEVIREDYVRTARAKGLREQLVIVRHALPNAILPVITWSSLFLGVALGGSVAIEKAFGVPGLGVTMVDAILDRDLPVVQNLVFLYTIIFIVVNLVTDMSYAWLDPRIRYE